MERIKYLNTYQKVVLLILLAMLVIFTFVYATATSQEGYAFKETVLLPSYKEGRTVYSGRIYDSDCSFTVTEDKVVSFRCEDKYYGPYTAREDPTAIPAQYADIANAVGVELRENGMLLFRGAVLTDQTSGFYLINEDGSLYGFSFIATMSDGTQVDENGSIVDPWKPSVYSILELMKGPELTRKGEWPIYFLGVFLSVITAVTVLFADELFRLSLAFSVRNWERAEPSDFEIAGRYISWTILPIAILIVYFMGLHKIK